MLVLSRKPGEEILVGKDVVISILRVRGNQVQVGIQAPKEVEIVRREIAGDEPEGGK